MLNQSGMYLLPALRRGSKSVRVNWKDRKKAGTKTAPQAESTERTLKPDRPPLKARSEREVQAAQQLLQLSITDDNTPHGLCGPTGGEGVADVHHYECTGSLYVLPEAKEDPPPPSKKET